MENKLTNDFEKLYGNLYDAMVAENKKNFKDLFTRQVEKGGISSFTTIKGRKYDSNVNLRFMMVGRAVNGWDERRYYSDNMTKDEFVKSSMCNFTNQKEALSDNHSSDNEMRDRFEWIRNFEKDDRRVAPKNIFRKGIDKNSEEEMEAHPYYLSRPIWGYTENVWCQLNNCINNKNISDHQAWEERWYENIVWSNLFKIAPASGGNPNKSLRKQQLEACKELLKAEINEFNPTHVLFLTNWDGWFDHFNDEYSFDYNNKEDYVAGSGKYKNSKMVVAVRPEWKPKIVYLEEVMKAFDAIKIK